MKCLFLLSALLSGGNFRFGNPVQQFQKKLKGEMIVMHNNIYNTPRIGTNCFFELFFV